MTSSRLMKLISIRSRSVLRWRNCGVIDPENINEYIAYDGYQALGKVLSEMKPEEVIQLLKDSGLGVEAAQASRPA